MINTDPNHQHTYDEQGNMICCSLEEKVYTKANAKELINPVAKSNKDTHTESETVDHKHSQEIQENGSAWKQYLPSIISFILLISGILLDYVRIDFFKEFMRVAWYAIAYIPVGFPVMKEGWEALRKKEFFTEFTLMTIATLGAFAIGEYPEGVAVMLFYAIGELFQSAAVRRAKGNIKALLDVRPSTASVLRDNQFKTVKPEEVGIGETIQIKAGEKVPLDGEMLSQGSSFNTAALTGESKPRSIYKSEKVLAGMLNLDKVVEVKVTKVFSDSSLARILDMVQNASSRKAKTELFIRKFAKIYTPIVFFLGLALVFVPYFFVEDYNFNQWLYRSLIFLVISCPCALVISIPLGYFGGIGAASRNGVLFKGSNYLDLMTRLNTIVMDKTGTLTKGVFKVQDIVIDGNNEEFMKILAALESKSTHPIAKAIVEHEKDKEKYEAKEIEEIPGHGLKGKVNGMEVLAGNTKLLKKFNIAYDPAIDSIVESILVVAHNRSFAGYVLIADQIKEDAIKAMKDLHGLGITEMIMLSGDKDSITQKVAKTVGIDKAFGNLLPEDKVKKVEELKMDSRNVLAFVGDGINDAPVLALSDVGIAMGAMGSDAAIETADVVIQTDQPSKIVTAIKIGKSTRKIVIQNITLAFVVKVIVLGLGAGGLATMWEAVFADVGVALLAILNAVRIQRMKF
ncbi:MAG: cadmium-translocating P-type ATPase [Bacteroidetes bacterium]|nr:cadmium-translocating P-type ATPase [Bacteroidota bacterium]